MLTLPPKAIDAHHKQLLRSFTADDDKDIRNAISIVHTAGTLVILMTSNTCLTIEDIPTFIASLCKIVHLDIIAISIAQATLDQTDEQSIIIMTDDGNYTLISMYDAYNDTTELSAPQHLTMSDSIDPELNVMGPLYRAMKLMTGDFKSEGRTTNDAATNIADYAANIICNEKIGVFEFNSDLLVEHVATQDFLRKMVH